MDAEATVTPHHASSGLDRRSLIKRAAAVGAAAWTAPVIIGSLASPAGALTVPMCYLYVVQVDRSGSTGNASAVVSGDPSCAATPSGIPTLCGGSYTRLTLQTEDPVGTVTTSASYNAGQGYFNFTFGLPNGSPCSIAATTSTPGATDTTACAGSPSFVATAGSPTSVNFDITASNVSAVRAWAYVVVACP